MKVLYVLSGSTIFSGSSKAFMGLLDFVIKEGIQVAVLCPEKNGIYSDLVERGIEVVVSDVRFGIWPIRKGIKHKILFIPRLIYRNAISLLAYIRLLKFAKMFRPDIIHTNVSVVNIGFKVAKKLKVPHVWHLREYADLDFDLAPSYKSFVKKLNSDNNYCISITEGIKIHHNLSDLKCEVIYDGVMSKESCHYNPHKLPYFLFAGRLDEAKGIETCIRAFVDYYHESGTTTELWVAGDTVDNQYFKYLRGIASDAPVKFLGMRKDIFDLMSKAKALVVPSIHEGFGFITAEAMFNGCLVIGRNTSGTKEQMDNGLKITGKEIALRFETEKDLKTVLRKIDTEDVNVFKDMIFAGQNVVCNMYSTEAHAAKVLSLYNRILNESKK